MEDLLTPQICMDVDETPLDVGKDDDASDGTSSETGEPEVDDDEKIKLLLEEKFSDSAQVPEELTDFEKEAKKNVFAIGEPAVQFQRLHCTACNIHLGSAPIGHFTRYIHPLLKVLLCKSCYEFYCSGEFDKDEDGSEMYCRWCGQGGKVMCCAQCAYVFCQKCVRQNLGKRTLELIKDSDDWLCFACNPTQLINLKIICTSLFHFVQDEIRLSKSLNNIERLKVDYSVCCQKVKSNKRKREEDITYIPHKNEWEEPKAKRTSILKSTLTKPTDDNTKARVWNQKEEAEVVCTPDLLSLMEDDPPPLTPMPKPTAMNKPTSTNTQYNKELNKPYSSTSDPLGQQPRVIRADGKKLYAIAPKTMMICNANNFQKSAPSFIRLQTPALKFVPSVNRTTPILNSIPAQIVPGTKHEWYDKAATVVSTITGNLSSTLMNLTKEQRSAKSVEQLANIHNKLQELLSSSVNSLIQVRKNLRAEFLDDLNKLKFSNPNTYRNTNVTATALKAKVNNSSNKENDDDDDVIIVNTESSTAKAFTEPPPLVKIADAKSNTRPYLKVRSVSQLLTVSSECITIPDDPTSSEIESADVIPVEEKDPLALSPNIPETPTIIDETTNVKDTMQSDDSAIIKDKSGSTEKRIEQLVLENMKYKVEDFSEEELKRILSVHVLISTDFRDDLPKNRLKTMEAFENDADAESITSKETTNVMESEDINAEPNTENVEEDQQSKDANCPIEEDDQNSQAKNNDQNSQAKNDDQSGQVKDDDQSKLVNNDDQNSQMKNDEENEIENERGSTTKSDDESENGSGKNSMDGSETSNFSSEIRELTEPRLANEETQDEPNESDLKERNGFDKVINEPCAPAEQIEHTNADDCTKSATVPSEQITTDIGVEVDAPTT